MGKGRKNAKDRLEHLKSCLQKDIVYIPLNYPEFNFTSPKWGSFRKAVLRAGALDVIWGRECNFSGFLEEQIRVGDLPHEVMALDPYIGYGYISVYSHMCIEDLRSVIEAIEGFSFGKRPRMQVDSLFICYKRFPRKIIDIGPKPFQCMSSQHGHGHHALSMASAPDINLQPQLSRGTWQELEDDVSYLYKDDISSAGFSGVSYDEFYCTVYKLFINKDVLDSLKICYDGMEGNVFWTIYSKLVDRIETHVQFLSQIVDKESQLSYLLISWDSFCDESAELHKTFEHMDLSVLELWKGLFCNEILSSAYIRQSVQDALHSFFVREQKGDTISQDLLKSAIELFMTCSVYEDLVEKPYLAECQKSIVSICCLEQITAEQCMPGHITWLYNHLEQSACPLLEHMDSKTKVKVSRLIVAEMLNHFSKLGSKGSYVTHLMQNGFHEEISYLVNMIKWDPDAYKDYVEKPYLEECRQRILKSRLLQKIIAGKYSSGYFTEVQSRMMEEACCVPEYMDSKMQDLVSHLILTEMIDRYVTKLCVNEDAYVLYLVDNDNYEEISKFVKITKGVSHAYEVGFGAVKRYMERRLTSLVANHAERPADYILPILNERERFENIACYSYEGDMRLSSALYLMFQKISSQNFQLAEYISLFIDHVLSTELKELNHLDVDDLLDKVVLLVADLEDKAAFELYYQRHLSDRLLSDVSDIRKERTMITKLRPQLCPAYLKKLEGMIDDIVTSKHLMQVFSDTDVAGTSLSMCVYVLTSVHWPRQPITRCTLPDELARNWEVFRHFYVDSCKNRRLEFCTSLGKLHVCATFGSSRKYDLILPTYHMSILLLFESDESMSLEEIRRRTSIPLRHLKMCLSSLCSVKGKNVLRKEPAGMHVSKHDRFYLNQNFSSKTNCITFQSVVKLKDVKVVLEEEKATFIDQLILKFVKGTPAMGIPGHSFNSIVKELSKSLKKKFRVTPKAIQTRIDALICWEVVVKVKQEGIVYYMYYLNRS